jgi:MoaA/NifB/PqqE/SkfB family radical SAM enzyme
MSTNMAPLLSATDRVEVDASAGASSGPPIDFANILFAGPCNRACPFCIGKLMPERVNHSNLSLFPPKGIDPFIAEMNRLGIRQIVFTGTTTDPQLYRFEVDLLRLLRERVMTGAQYSVHTNGVLAIKKMTVFNEYDRACISFPSFVPATYEKMMGSRTVPDLAAILAQARIPVKVSCVVNEHNVQEIDSFLERCGRIGVRRLVLRKLYGDQREWPLLRGLPIRNYYRGNPVVDLAGMEVTYWDFDLTSSRSINLFADGTIGTSYLLTATPEFRQ